MIHYIIQIFAFQLLFLMVYDFFLKKETFFNWNRFYLIITPILSIVLPLIKINAIQETIPQEYVIQLPAVIIGSFTNESIINAAWYSNATIWMVIWGIGFVLSLLFFSRKQVQINQLKKTGIKTRWEGMNIITLPKTDTAFSYFNTIFLGEELSEKQKSTILLHEKIHVSDKHSIDLLWFEILRIVLWFNPLVYIYQKRMVILQEFIADANVASQKDKASYYQDLLSQVFNTEAISFINPFFNHSLIKKRIIMLQKSKSSKFLKLKYLLLVPIVCSMLVYSSCTQETKAQNQTAEIVETKTDSKSKILKNIEALTESIAEKGEITEEEEYALKELMVLTDGNGLDSPYYEDVKDFISMPFGVINKVPTYPGCTGNNEELKKCFSKSITQYVANEFNTEVGKESNISGKQRIAIKFKIDNTGKVTSIKARAPAPELEKEAIRVINALPQMLPGEHEGKKVGVLYSLPIIFDIME
ncbi:MAG: bla regulator protein BlaR1 [Flavobacteriaceae bacterium]|jgi:bla regulator protein BlaR1